MKSENLPEIYNSILPGVKKVYVVPLINFDNKESDYLYLLYKKFLEEKESKINIESLSVFAHPKFFFSKILAKKIILHYHWFEVSDLTSLIGMKWKLFWIILYKFSGGKIIWTVHNKFPHSKSFISINKYIRKYFSKTVDKILVHCESAIDIMTKEFNIDKEKFLVVEHPEYPVKLIEREKAKKLLIEEYPSLNINDKKIFLMFGAIADYKGIKEAAKIFKNHFPDKILLIAGRTKRWDKNYLQELLVETKGAENIIIINKEIPEVEIPLFFNGVDYLLFNFKDILTSGGVLMALSYNKKIICPAIGCLKELDNEKIIKFEPENREENLIKILDEIKTRLYS